MAKWIVGLCALLLYTSVAMAQVEVKVVLEPSEIPYHKQSFVHLIVEVPEGIEVTLPDLRPVLKEAKLIGDNTAVANFTKEPLEEGRVRITETYALDPNFVQDYTFAPIVFTVGEEIITVPGPTLRVRDLTEAEMVAVEQFDGSLVGGPKAVSRPLTERWEFWVLLGLMAIVLVALAVYVWRTRDQLQALEPEKEPWEQALLRLEALLDRKLPKQGMYETFYVDLSAILRYYIEGRFSLHAPERTTPEFLLEMMATDTFDAHQQEFLKAFLRLCDQVKFAKHQPGSIEMEESFVDVRTFIEETIPKESASDNPEEMTG